MKGNLELGLRLIFAFLFFFCAILANAQPKNAPRIYYDADDLQIAEKTGNLTATGNALILVHDAFIQADRIVLLYDKNIVTAEGDVRVIRKKERIDGSRLVMDLDTKEMRFEEVYMVADAALTDAIVEREVLGFTPAEVAFDEARTKRLIEIQKELNELRESFLGEKNLARLSRSPGSLNEMKLAEIERRYAQLMARYMRTQEQQNIFFAQLTPKEQAMFKDRRDGMAALKKKQTPAYMPSGAESTAPGYVRIKAKSLYQNKEGIYEFQEANLTPCRCDRDDSSIYSFDSQQAYIEPNQYATMNAAAISFGDMPVAYTPWLRFPIKTKRESGFLFPSFYASRSGEASSLPYFWAINDHSDATFTLNNFSKRGVRTDGEFRLQITPESGVFLQGEQIRDAKYVEEYNAEKEKLDNKINNAEMTTRYEEDRARTRLGSVRKERWYAHGKWNVPATSYLATKADGEFVSDNRYIGDFSEASAASFNPLSPTRNPKRFLTQEAATEYYGSDVVMSARLQSMRDLFAPVAAETPMRLPRVEFYLLPKRFFGLPFSVDQYTTWERVSRLGGHPFIDLAGENLNAPTGRDEAQVLERSRSPDGKKEFDEPYIVGNRLFTQQRLTVPLPANPYVNSWFAIRGVSTRYDFPEAYPYPNVHPYQSYVSYDSHLSIPLNGTATIFNAKRENIGWLRHDLTPYFNFSVIPKVSTDPNYPTQSRLWYAEDTAVAKEELVMGFTSDWSVRKNEFAPLDNIPQRTFEPIAPMNDKLFQESAEKHKVAVPNSSEDKLNFTQSQRSVPVFRDWAKRELDYYEKTVYTGDFGEQYVWPSTPGQVLAERYTMRPVSLRVETSYNFQSKKTEEELNSRKSLGQEPVKILPWGDIYTKLDWSVHPVVPINGSVEGTWSRFHQRWKEIVYSTSAYLGFNVTGSVQQRYKLVTNNKNGDLAFNRTTSMLLEYSPLNWVTLSYARVLEIDINNRVQPPEWEYSSSQTITLKNLQDCMDLILQRRKPRLVDEKYAVWALGINVKFMGYTRGLPEFARTVPEARDNVKRETGERP